MKLYRVVALAAALAITAFLASTPALMADAAARHHHPAVTVQHLAAGERAGELGPG